MFDNKQLNLPHTQEPRIELASTVEVQEYLQQYGENLPQLPDLQVKPQPWILINWPFLGRLDEVSKVFDELDLKPSDYFDIHGYTTAARYLYPYSTVTPDDFNTWGWYAVSKAMANGDGELGRVFLFPPELLQEDAYDHIFAAKHAIRKALGSIDFVLQHNGSLHVTDYRASHAPDWENVRKELNIVSNFRIDPES